MPIRNLPYPNGSSPKRVFTILVNLKINSVKKDNKMVESTSEIHGRIVKCETQPFQKVTEFVLTSLLMANALFTYYIYIKGSKAGILKHPSKSFVCIILLCLIQ